ncbi:MCE family protein [Amycolatopsis roodepoortensis]|uniref:MlaD family protein n=1 Tax=Amycolatopsis roodepoortensis TaxID=700274 RepID=UPI00214C5921|nr:MlaD family protein [Amycolatopsis roodepoortensis]UUV28636.1 MCE family protein [Amycolatopsis roodepoortensis]
MRISHSVMPVIRLLVLVVFAAACAVFFGYLWVNSGGKLPFSSARYQVTATFPRVANLVPDSDVMISGVAVGKVAEIKNEGERAHVTMELDQEYPLHQGVTVQVRNKTLVEETFLQLTDGSGPDLDSGTALPESAAKPAVGLNDVLASIDPSTRQALASTVRSLGASTKDSQDSISRALSGLGYLGREGQGALSALAAQSEDLKKLSGNTANLLAALDTRQGQIAQLVRDADTLTKTTADGGEDLKAVMRELPGVMDKAKSASGSLNELSGSLAPVAKNLNTAAPDLSKALEQLPETAGDLRGLLPALNGVLDNAPGTLERVPAVAADAHQLLPTLNVALGDVNPMLSYLQPYGRDIAAMFTNMGQALSRGDDNGTALRTFLILNEQSLRGNPLNLNNLPLLNKSNPYPAPGQSANPGPFQGQYPRVDKGTK